MSPVFLKPLSVPLLILFLLSRRQAFLLLVNMPGEEEWFPHFMVGFQPKWHGLNNDPTPVALFLPLEEQVVWLVQVQAWSLLILMRTSSHQEVNWKANFLLLMGKVFSLPRLLSGAEKLHLRIHMRKCIMAAQWDHQQQLVIQEHIRRVLIQVPLLQWFQNAWSLQ